MILVMIHIIIIILIGHSWGSPHDPGNNPDCTSRYLMNEFAQDSTEGSHRVRRDIKDQFNFLTQNKLFSFFIEIFSV